MADVDYNLKDLELIMKLFPKAFKKMPPEYAKLYKKTEVMYESELEMEKAIKEGAW